MVGLCRHLRLYSGQEQTDFILIHSGDDDYDDDDYDEGNKKERGKEHRKPLVVLHDMLGAH